MGQKLGSNRCPLFTMLTTQNSSKFCIVSFVKKTKGKWFHYLGRLAHTLTLVYFHGRPTHTLPMVYFHGRPAHTLGLPEIPSGDLLYQNQRMCVARSTWNPIWRFPLTKATWDPIWQPHSIKTKECVKRGLIVMGNQPRRKECEKKWSHYDGWPTQIERIWSVVSL